MLLLNNLKEVFVRLSLDDEVYVCRLYNNHHTNIILDINCCTTLLTLAIQSVRVRLDVTLERILEVQVRLCYESWVILSISSCCCCISLELLCYITSELLHPYCTLLCTHTELCTDLPQAKLYYDQRSSASLSWCQAPFSDPRPIFLLSWIMFRQLLI
jgi:hypothetical protein